MAGLTTALTVTPWPHNQHNGGETLLWSLLLGKGSPLGCLGQWSQPHLRVCRRSSLHWVNNKQNLISGRWSGQWICYSFLCSSHVVGTTVATLIRSHLASVLFPNICELDKTDSIKALLKYYATSDLKIMHKSPFLFSFPPGLSKRQTSTDLTKKQSKEMFS